ncbi:hypothetical protein [Salinimonas sediminis]|uniref:Cytochrome oxidase assembly protein n=1 Tax=Salinimonas sediminis TaxID=2303538 RepID=A0A346NHG5_9ALTE|nr:hypothetical protein [Salinimonas sediminis]AXR04972.1 hypothetical protein D0Y50_00450 [Salinimonas sediminis]
MSERKKNKQITLLTVFAIFVLPVVLAKLALDNQWFTRAATNKGELLQPVQDFSVYLVRQSPKWRLVYQLPAHCDNTCENALYSIQQVWHALGKEADRAQPTVIYTASSDAKAIARLKQQNSVEVLPSPPRQASVTGSQIDAHRPVASSVTSAIYLVDTMNNAMLRYPVSDDRQQAIMNSRDILADVRKLLKLSRIG